MLQEPWLIRWRFLSLWSPNAAILHSCNENCSIDPQRSRIETHRSFLSPKASRDHLKVSQVMLEPPLETNGTCAFLSALWRRPGSELLGNPSVSYNTWVSWPILVVQWHPCIFWTPKASVKKNLSWAPRPRFCIVLMISRQLWGSKNHWKVNYLEVLILQFELWAKLLGFWTLKVSRITTLSLILFCLIASSQSEKTQVDSVTRHCWSGNERYPNPPSHHHHVRPVRLSDFHWPPAFKNKMKPTNPNADTYVEEQKQYL